MCSRGLGLVLRLYWFETVTGNTKDRGTYFVFFCGTTLAEEEKTEEVGKEEEEEEEEDQQWHGEYH